MLPANPQPDNAYVSGLSDDLNFHGNELIHLQTIYSLGAVLGQLSFALLFPKVRMNYLVPALDILWGGTSFETIHASPQSNEYIYISRSLPPSLRRPPLKHIVTTDQILPKIPNHLCYRLNSYFQRFAIVGYRAAAAVVGAPSQTQRDRCRNSQVPDENQRLYFNGGQHSDRNRRKCISGKPNVYFKIY